MFFGMPDVSRKRAAHPDAIDVDSYERPPQKRQTRLPYRSRPLREPPNPVRDSGLMGRGLQGNLSESFRRSPGRARSLPPPNRSPIPRRKPSDAPKTLKAHRPPRVDTVSPGLVLDTLLLEEELDSFSYCGMNLRPRKTVELLDETFLRIAAIKKRHTKDGGSEIFLQGPQFNRNRSYEGFLPMKMNEVAMSCVSKTVPVTQVLKTRILILTNANFPIHRDVTGRRDDDAREGRLVCRWFENIVGKTEGYLYRLTESEADQSYRVQDSKLREGWRGDLTKAARATESTTAKTRGPAALQGGTYRKGKGSHKANATEPGYPPHKSGTDVIANSHSVISVDCTETELFCQGDIFMFGGGGSTEAAINSRTPKSVLFGYIPATSTLMAHTEDFCRPQPLSPPATPRNKKFSSPGNTSPPVTRLSDARPQLRSPQSLRPTYFEKRTDTLPYPLSPCVAAKKPQSGLPSDSHLPPSPLQQSPVRRNHPASPKTPRKGFPFDEKSDSGVSPTARFNPRDLTSPVFPGTRAVIPPPLKPLTPSPGVAPRVVHVVDSPQLAGKLPDEKPRSHKPTTLPIKPGPKDLKLGSQLRKPDLHPKRRAYTFGDAFCGGGGMSSGARSAGFVNTWSFDCDSDAIDTYRSNFPRCVTYHSTVTDFLTLPPKDLFVDVVHLSPPCQPHSPAHTIAGKDDDRNEASLFCVRQCLEAARPRIVTLEQTDGILNREEWFRSLVMMFTDLGFSLSWKVLHGVEYGVPQKRKRLFLLAASPGEELPNFPSPKYQKLKPTDDDYPFGLLPPRTVSDAISNIPPSADSHVAIPFPTPRISPVDPDQPLLATILASGGPYDIHPDGLRPFTPRELACLQTFPLSHKFFGTPFQKKKQIGNAVPPVLAEALMNEVRKTLEKTGKKPELARGEGPRRETTPGSSARETRGGRPHIPIQILDDDGDVIILP